MMMAACPNIVRMRERDAKRDLLFYRLNGDLKSANYRFEENGPGDKTET